MTSLIPIDKGYKNPLWLNGLKCIRTLNDLKWTSIDELSNSRAFSGPLFLLIANTALR